jgi:glycosyltransferase involved in cell wall biosynthesis
MGKAIHLLNSFKHGGGETVALNYSKIMKTLGIDSIFIGRSVSEEFSDMLLEYGDIQFNINKSVINKSDYIFVHTNKSLLKLIQYLPIIWRKKKRVLYIQHLNYSNFKFSILSKLINFICTDFIQITPITSIKIKNNIKINTIYLNNFYLNTFNETEWIDIKKKKRNVLSIDSNATVIMFSAVFKEGKGLRNMLDLVSQIIELHHKKYVFLIVGDGPERDLIQNFKYKDKLIWTGFVNDVEEYLIASDIYFFPSLFNLEMMPMALIEAINTDKKILSFKTEINNFLLNDCTCIDIVEVLHNLYNDIYPCNLVKYDYKYAFDKFKSIFKL